MSEYKKEYFFVRVSKNIADRKPVCFYYGKNSTEIPVGRETNLAWYIKEYGFDTLEKAKKNIRKIKNMYTRNGFLFSEVDVAQTTVLFSSYEEYLRVRPMEA